MSDTDTTQTEAPVETVETTTTEATATEETVTEAPATEEAKPEVTATTEQVSAQDTATATEQAPEVAPEPEPTSAPVEQQPEETLVNVVETPADAPVEDEVVTQADDTQAEQAEAELVGDLDDGTKAVNDYFAKRDVLAYDISKFLLDSAAASLTVKTNVDGVDFVVQVNQLDEYGNRIQHQAY